MRVNGQNANNPECKVLIPFAERRACERAQRRKLRGQQAGRPLIKPVKQVNTREPLVNYSGYSKQQLLEHIAKIQHSILSISESLACDYSGEARYSISCLVSWLEEKGLTTVSDIPIKQELRACYRALALDSYDRHARINIMVLRSKLDDVVMSLKRQ